MPLDPENPITPLQSSTVKAALTAIIINVLTLITVFTGKSFNIAFIQSLIDMGLPLAVNAVSVWYGLKTIKGRINATQTIAAPSAVNPPSK